ncbi:hypothetical protein [Streptomyces sp. SID13666]|uniref:hypothetical protein n=1 Tax=Streptomyces sp. SID13666 TaxID=2706054 RepID=UPI0013CDB105|nr:hypothetical protein [Streptomyces sp. SID13666]NEA76825.1 hypothetical protein [Streptomyces sp. SID13588]
MLPDLDEAGGLEFGKLRPQGSRVVGPDETGHLIQVDTVLEGQQDNLQEPGGGAESVVEDGIAMDDHDGRPRPWCRGMASFCC